MRKRILSILLTFALFCGLWVPISGAVESDAGDNTASVVEAESEDTTSGAAVTDIESTTDVMGTMYISRDAIQSITADKIPPEGYESENAIDGNPESIWHSPWNNSEEQNFPHELIIVFDEPQQINTVAYLPRQLDASGNAPVQFINDYEFLVSESDEGEFTFIEEIAKWEKGDGRSEVTTRFKETVSAKRIKFLIKAQDTNGKDNFCTSVAELRFGLTDDPVIVPIESEQVLRMTVTDCSTENAGYKKEFAADGAANTFWHNEWTPQAEFPHWLELDLHHVYNFSGLDILPRQDQNNISMAITEYNLYVKNAAEDEYTLVVDAGELDVPAWGDYARIKLPESIPARYIKIEAINDISGKNSAIAELTAWFDKSTESEVWMTLLTAIRDARAIAASVVVGSDMEQFPAKALEAYVAAVDAAESVLNEAEADDELSAAATALAVAEEALEAQRIRYTKEELAEKISEAERLKEEAAGKGPTENSSPASRRKLRKQRACGVTIQLM